MSRFIALLVVLITLGSCSESEPPSAALSSQTTHNPAIVARFAEIEITAADVDAHILVLPPSQRPLPGEDLDTWYQEQIRQLAVARWLRTEARERGIAREEAFVARRREIEKQLAVQLCLGKLQPQVESIDEEARRAAYDTRREQFAIPERRFAYHLFRRLTADMKVDTAHAELESIRDRVLHGENFRRLAAALSDSESRHREGSLGWIQRGQLPDGFERVIFALDEGIPSLPVVTRAGIHLFYVDNILPARQLEFDEVRSTLQAQLQAERRETVLNEIADAIETPSSPSGPTREEFAALVKTGDNGGVVLRSGDTELSLRDLRVRLGQTLAHQYPGTQLPGSLPVELAWNYLERLRRQERIYQHCRDENAIPADELTAGLSRWEEQALLAVQRQRRLLEIAQRDPVRLELFYRSNIGNFSTAPKWKLRRLRVPLGENATEVMVQLEQAALQAGGSLDELRTALGGKIEELGWRSLAELRELAPKLPALVTPLSAGQLSSPYRGADALELVEVVARQESEPIPFDEIREGVAAAYVNQYTKEVYDQLASEILETADFRILPEGIASLRAAGLPQPDISVEQLEQLLDEL